MLTKMNVQDFILNDRIFYNNSMKLKAILTKGKAARFAEKE